MYSGNIGLYYDLENLIKVVEKFGAGTKTADGREVVFAFVGAGSVLKTLEDYVAEHPKKLSDDIADLLLTRYKIFSRINFHHRCMKTSVALQSAVLELAEDYLKNPRGKEINSEINVLWSALNMGAGDRRIRIIQWNDSWLISVLHKALVKILLEQKDEKTLRENLEEILLNKKRYYTLIKRGADSQKFVRKVFEVADITEERLEKLKQKEYRKYYSSENKSGENIDLLKKPQLNAEESLKRIRDLEIIRESGDLELLNSLMPLDTYKECTTAAAVVRVLGGKFLEVHIMVK